MRVASGCGHQVWPLGGAVMIISGQAYQVDICRVNVVVMSHENVFSHNT